MVETSLANATPESAATRLLSMIQSHFSTKPAPARRSLFRTIRAMSLGVITVALIAGCGKKQAGAAGGPGGQGAPMEVGVLTIAPAPVTLTQDLPGRISAFRVAEVRARVNGIVLKRLFTEGSDVTEGQVLYEIDPAPYQAALDSALGTLARAEANATTARLKEERFKQLLATKAISKQDYDDALANRAHLRCGRAFREGGGADGADQSRLHQSDFAGRRAHRHFAGDRGRLRAGEHGDPARHGAAARPRLCGRDPGQQ